MIDRKLEDKPSEPHSQFKLVWQKFLRNKLAVVGGIAMVLLTLAMILAGFLSPYPTDEQHLEYRNVPPQRIRVFADGKLARPYVLDYEVEVNAETLRRTYTATGSMIPVRFFLRGHSYRVFGIVKSTLHLFGSDSGFVFLLGTDRFGRDMLSRILAGTTVSLTIGLVSVAISLVIGTILGTISGYYGGAVDMVVQRIVEFLQGFPRIPLWMGLAAALPPEWSSIRVFFGMMALLALLNWTGLARQIRSKVLSYRHEDYVTAARAMGERDSAIMFTHLIPACTSHILVIATLNVPQMILVESSLSFLGLGIRPPMTSLGVLLQDAQNVQSVLHYPWLLLPGLVIVVAVLALNFLGDGLRDAADPYSS